MKNFILVILAGWALSGCATMARGTNVNMIVDTEPQGATVTTDLETKTSQRARKKDYRLAPINYGCPATPCEFEMSRRSVFIMTITKDGFEPVEIGVDYSLHKESMNANLAGSAGVGAVAGATTGAIGIALASSFSSVSTGSIVGAAALSAASVAAGVGVISIGVDSATGAMMNLNPNPVFIVLPPEGTAFEPDPKVDMIRNGLKVDAAHDASHTGPLFPKDK